MKIVVVLIVLLLLVACSPEEVPEPEIPTLQPEVEEILRIEPKETLIYEEVVHIEPENTGVPTNLSLPFKIEDVDLLHGEVNPLGVVRFDKDQGDIGHPGIDIPLKQGSSIFAVANGPVVLITSAGDPWNGMAVSQLLKKTGDGTGWVFTYEHIELAEGIIEGTELKRGDLVGTKKAPEGFTLHLQLSKFFDGFKYSRDPQCWPNLLNNSKEINSWWETYSASQHLRDSWATTIEEGKYGFKGLLETSQYPNGPQLCYALGTDVRSG
jgi:murein DD-endopeptidase MepM/ murein hydrolase activator NlpD